MISKELELELKREVYKESYFEFFKFCFKILNPNESYEDNFHIKYLCDLLQKEVERILRNEEKEKDIIVNIPPRASKSMITSVCLLPYVWLRMPTATFICVSFDTKLANKNSQDCRDIIRSTEYQELFGDIYQIRGDADGKEFFQNDKGGFRISTTTGANITGAKCLFCIIDDPQNPLTSLSKNERDRIIYYYRNSLYNRLTPERLGLRLLIQQRLHVEDLTGDLINKNKDEYEHICLPAEISDNIQPTHLVKFYKDGLLDPKRLSEKTLIKFKKNLGSLGYIGQYGQRPSIQDGGIFKRNWFTIVQPETLVRNTDENPIHFIIDGAYTEKTTNDPTAIMACYEKENHLYILDVQEVWMNFPDLCKFIVEYVNKFQYSPQNSKIYVEPKANGLPIIDQLRATTMLNVVSLTPTKDSKMTRANAVSPIAESQRIKLVHGVYIENYMSQMCAFPNAAHDDMVDITIYAIDTLLIKGQTPDFFFVG